METVPSVDSDVKHQGFLYTADGKTKQLSLENL